MHGCFKTIADFSHASGATIVQDLMSTYPEAEESQIRSWKVLVSDIKSTLNEVNLPPDLSIVIEYSLPTDGMAADLLIAGLDEKGNRRCFVIESKQWDDAFISKSQFTTYRQDGFELHPEVQVSRHVLSFRDYLSVGSSFETTPYVFLRNATAAGVKLLTEKHPSPGNKRASVKNQLAAILVEISAVLKRGDPSIIDELKSAQFCPCKGIVDAMQSIVTHEEPFILTPEQNKAVDKIREAIKSGKQIIRVTGAAGAGKTAILLNLFVTVLKRSPKTGIVPIFISGRQNTALYRSIYPQSEDTFTLPWTLDKTVQAEYGSRFMLFMDEAQHNDEGVVTNMVNRGARLVLCYDEHQTINANNPIAELKQLESRSDFTTIELKESVRYNGSSVAEKNIRSCLAGETSFSPDDKFEFKVFTHYDTFQDQIYALAKHQPNSTLAVTSMLKTLPPSPNQRLFSDWGSRTECKWMPYVRNGDYLKKFNGKIWVGSWWMPGLDVDYTAVIVGDDAILTPQGLVADIDKVKMFAMIVSIAKAMKLPSNLVVNKPNLYGSKSGIDYYTSYKNILEFIHRKGNQIFLTEFTKQCTEYIRNCYYIMMTRGKKGCLVYFARTN